MSRHQGSKVRASCIFYANGSDFDPDKVLGDGIEYDKRKFFTIEQSRVGINEWTWSELAALET
jgi:hypothetical protein